MTNLPENWTICKLEDCLSITMGQSPNSNSYNENRIGLPFYQGSADFGELYPISRKWCSAPIKIAEKNDVLLSIRAPVGHLNICYEKSCIGRGLSALHGKGNISNHFVFFLLKNLQQTLHENSTGTTFLAITGERLKNISIPLPPLAEQGRIAAKIEELFAGIDAGVENLKSVKNQIALYRQSVLKSAFNIKNAVIQKASEIGEVSLGRQRSPKNISKFYPTKYIRAANISENGIDVSDILDMEFLPYEKEKYLLKQNDILLSEASGSPNHVGKPAIWNNEIDDCCFQNTVIRHRLFGNHPKYVFWFYKYLYLSSFFAKLAGGVGINHIGSTKFSNIKIPIPSLDEQKRIVAEIESRFERADALETAVDRALNDAEKLKQAVLKKAFSGELVPQNPDDEPASVLLDRIRAARASELPAKKGKRK